MIAKQIFRDKIYLEIISNPFKNLTVCHNSMQSSLHYITGVKGSKITQNTSGQKNKKLWIFQLVWKQFTECFTAKKL